MRKQWVLLAAAILLGTVYVQASDEINLSVNINTDLVSIQCILADTTFVSEEYESLFRITNLRYKPGGKECMNYTVEIDIDGPDSLQETIDVKCVNSYRGSGIGHFSPTKGGSYTVCGMVVGTKQKDCKEVAAVDTRTDKCNISLQIRTNATVYDKGTSVKYYLDLNNESYPFVIEYWIEDLFGNVVKARLNTTNTNQKSWTPKEDDKLQAYLIKGRVFPSCDDDIADNHAEKLIVVKNEDHIGVSDEQIIAEATDKESAGDTGNKTKSTKISSKKFYYEIIALGNITLGEPFYTTVRIVNNEDIMHNLSIWSYLYRGSSCISGGREENMQMLEVEASEEKVIELENMVMSAEAGDYKLKVRLKKDDQKTTIDLTENVSVLGSAQGYDGSTGGAEKIVAGNSGGKASAGKGGTESELRAFVIPSAYIITKTDKLYKSVSERSKDIAVWLISLFMVLLIVIVWKKW